MRQRNIKNKEAIIQRCRAWLVEDPAALSGRWRESLAQEGPLYLELGSGKGHFIVTRAGACPDQGFIAVEANDNIMVRILEKAEAAGSTNLLVLPHRARDLTLWFEEGELDGLFIFFPDPWPKLRHARRRLTHRSMLAQYRQICKPGATLDFATDKEALFRFTLAEARACGLALEPLLEENGYPLTEYEEKFRALGKPVHKARLILPGPRGVDERGGSSSW